MMGFHGEPLVSVCIVTYNHARYIRRCIDSVIAQQADFSFEVLVGDDASTDGAREIISSYVDTHPNIVSLISTDRNVGPGENCRRTHRLARGRYVAYLDGDDSMKPGKLAAQVKILEREPAVSGVFHDMECLDSDGLSTSETFSPVAPPRFDMRYAVVNHAVAAISSLMYRRRSLDTFWADESDCFDMRIIVELGATGDFRFIPRVLGSYTAGVGLSQRIPWMMPLVFAAIDRAIELGLDPRDAVLARCASSTRAALNALRLGDTTTFRNQIEYAWRQGSRSLATGTMYSLRNMPFVLRALDAVYRPLRNRGLMSRFTQQ